MTSSMYNKREYKEQKVHFQSSTGPDIYMVQFTIYGFTRFSHLKGVLRLGRKIKLSPRFIGSFKILERIGSIAYKLTLPPSLTRVQDVFHVSMLRKYMTDSIRVIDYEPLQLSEDLSYKEKPIRILAQEVKALRNRDIAFIKVLWQNPTPRRPRGSMRTR